MAARDFRLTGGKSLIDGIPVSLRSKSLGVASHRAIAAPGSADGTLLTLWNSEFLVALEAQSGLDHLLPTSH